MVVKARVPFRLAVIKSFLQRQNLEPTREYRTKENLCFLGIVLLTTILFRTPLTAVASLSLEDDRYLGIAVAPFMGLFLVYWERIAILSQARFSPRVGVPLLSLAMLLSLTCTYWQPRINEAASQPLVVFAVILVWMAAFILCYGAESFRTALFPLCCLFLMIPVPPALMNWITVGLQHASAATSFALLRVAGIPVFRQGMEFLLPGLSIQVAPECSGIRSCLAFAIAALLVGRVYLRSGWRRLALIVLTIPIAIFKNAVRIVVISSLTVYVNRTIIDGPLHHQGGPVFAVLDIVAFVPLLYVFRRSEGSRHGRETEPTRVICGVC